MTYNFLSKKWEYSTHTFAQGSGYNFVSGNLPTGIEVRDNKIVGYNTKTGFFQFKVGKSIKATKFCPGYNSIAIKPNGQIVVWTFRVGLGNENSFGQLTPPTGLSGADVIDVEASASFSVALKSNGTVVTWGSVNGNVPVPTGLTGVTKISAGGAFILALKNDGTVVAWGNNEYNQCIIPTGLSNVIDITTGAQNAAALKSDGTVVVWGNLSSSTLAVPSGLTGVTSIVSGYNHLIALKNDGTVVAWGEGINGVFRGWNNIVKVTGGYDWVMGLKQDGTTIESRTIDLLTKPPIQSEYNDVAEIRCTFGAYQRAVLKSDGTIYSYSNNYSIPYLPSLWVPSDGTDDIDINYTIVNGAPQFAPVDTVKSNLTAQGLTMSTNGEIFDFPTDWVSDYMRFEQNVKNNYNLYTRTGSISTDLTRQIYFVDTTDCPIDTITFSGLPDGLSAVDQSTEVKNGKYENTFLNGTRLSLDLVSKKYLTGAAKVAPGTYNVQITATGTGGSSTQSIPIVVVPFVSDETTPLTYDQAVTFLPSFDTKRINYTKAVAKTALPSSLSYNSSTSVVSGTPREVGTFNTRFDYTYPIPGITQMAVSGYVGLFLANGKVYSWGSAQKKDYDLVGNDFKYICMPGVSATGGSYGVRTNGTVVGSSRVVGTNAVPTGLSDVIQVAVTSSCVIALRSTENGGNSIVQWGSAQFANPPTGSLNITKISVGYDHAVALTSFGTLIGWGNNTYGQISLSSFSDVAQVEAGYRVTVIRFNNGTVRIVGTGTTFSVGRALVGLVASSISVGRSHLVILKTDGTVVVYTTSTTVTAGYLPPSGLVNVAEITTGTTTNCALKSDGTLVPWGYSSWSTDADSFVNNVQGFTGYYGLTLNIGIGAPKVDTTKSISGRGKVPLQFQIQLLSPEQRPATNYSCSNLPAGFTLDESTGVISGASLTNTLSTTLSITVTGPGGSNTSNLSMVLTAAVGKLYFRDSPLLLADGTSLLIPENRGIKTTKIYRGNSLLWSSIPGSWTPTQIAPRIWYDPSDSSTITLDTTDTKKVTGVKNKAGNLFNLAPYNNSLNYSPWYGTRTLNGLPVWEWPNYYVTQPQGACLENTTTFSFGNDFGNYSSGFLIGFVAQVDNISGFSQGYYFSGGTSTASGSRFSFRNIASTLPNGDPTIIYAFLGSNVGTTSNLQVISSGIGAGYATRGVPVLLVLKLQGSSSYFRANGVQVGSGNIGTNFFSDFHLGHTESEANDLIGFMGEVVGISYYSIYGSSRTTTIDQDAITLEGYLAHKWGLQANLPDNHLHKSSPP